MLGGAEMHAPRPARGWSGSVGLGKIGGNNS